MPGLAATLEDACLTPGRKTVLYLDLPEVTLKRQEWSHQRGAAHIRRQKQAGEHRTENVFNSAGDAWLLTPRFFDLASALIETDDRQYLNETDVDLAPGYRARQGFRKRSDLPGLDEIAELVDAGATMFFKGVNLNDGSLWSDAVLAADAAAFPGPDPEPGQNTPVDRVLAGKVTHPANCAYLLRFMLPPDWGGSDTFLQFYFGGSVLSTPDGTAAGEFCTRLRGNGQGVLFERKADGTWRRAQEFEWGGEQRAMGAGVAVAAMLGVVPYANDRILITAPSAALIGTGGDPFIGLMLTRASVSKASQTRAGQNLYRDQQAMSGHTHLGGATGAGVIRLDRHRKDGRMPVSLIRGLYPTTGTLIDSSFPIPTDLPVGELLRVSLLVSTPTGTSIEVALHDAETGDEIPETSSGSQVFETTAARSYYLRFTFHTNTIWDATPVLFSYTVQAAGEFRTVERTPILVTNVHGADLTGPGLECNSEMGAVLLQDVTDQAALLRVRDRVRTTVSVLDSGTGALITHLMEGEVTQSPHANRGDGGPSYPGAWRELNVNLVGLGRRLGEQFSERGKSFANTADSPPEYGHHLDADPQGQILPWFITDVIRFLIRNSGFRDDEIDVPHIPLRFWPSLDLNSEDYLLQPGVFYGDVAQDLAFNFLGMVLLRDPNAGPRGMWRLIPNPSPTSTNYLAYLHRGNPGLAGGTLATHPGAYPAGHTFFLRRGSEVLYHQHPRAPLYNHIRIFGTKEGTADESAGLFLAEMFNYASINDPESVDYIGHPVPYVLYDPLLTGQEACNWLCRQVYDRVGRATVWWEGVAPLLFVTDPLDALQVRPRPLRINDLVLIDGFPALVHSCNADIHSVNQLMHLEGRFL